MDITKQPRHCSFRALRQAHGATGDLLSGAWIGTSLSPGIALKNGATDKHGKLIWDESFWTSDVDGFGYFVARGGSVHALVLSHSCEIDKHGGTVPVLVAPIYYLSIIQNLEARELTRKGDRFAFMPIDAITGVIPESYADLRLTSYLQRSVVDTRLRNGSASTDGARLLTAKLVAFLTRVDINNIVGK